MTSFEKLLNENLSVFKENEIVSATVIEINNKNVVVDFNFKSEALLDINEFRSYRNQELSVSVNDTIDLLIEEIDNGDGYPTLSYHKAQKEKGKKNIQKSFNEEESYIEVVGKKLVNKGFVASYEGYDIFIPYSLLDIRKKENFDFLMNTKFFIKVIKVDFERDSIFGSRKYYLEKEEGINVLDKIKELNIGDIIEGEVKSFVKYGAFLDLGFTDSLLHLNDVSWKNFDSVKDLFNYGDILKVKVTGVDLDKERVYISLKENDLSIWDDFKDNFKKNDKIDLTVSRIKHNGLVVQYNNAIDFFIHYTELSWYSIKNKIENHYSIGEKVIGHIRDIDYNKKGAFITLKSKENNPIIMFSKNNKFGDKFDATIVETGTKFLKIKIGEVIGYIFGEELSWNYDSHKVLDNYKKNDTVEVSFKSADVDNYALKFSIKDTIENPFSKYSEESSGTEVEVVVLESKNNIILVQTDNGVKTLVQNRAATDINVGNKLTLKIKNSNDFSLELMF
jgi:small subunit ribosomal protein S1